MVKTINNINVLHHSPRINHSPRFKPWAMVVTPCYNETVLTVSKWGNTMSHNNKLWFIPWAMVVKYIYNPRFKPWAVLTVSKWGNTISHNNKLRFKPWAVLTVSNHKH